MSVNKKDLQGTERVFSFTLQQYLKSKANIVSAVVLLVMALCSVPLMVLLGGGSGLVNMDYPDTVVVDNQTDLPLRMTPAEDGWEKIRFTMEPCDGAVKVTVAQNADGDYTVMVSGEENMLARMELEDLFIGFVEDGQYYQRGVTPEQLAILRSGYEVTDGGEGGEEAEFSGLAYTVQIGYAILVMVICTMAGTNVVRTVAEEKGSKLVELLMTSVRPLALMVGKVLAVLVYVAGLLLAMLLAFMASFGLSSLLLDTSELQGQLAAVTSVLPRLELDVWHILGAAAIVLVSLLLAYLTVAVVSAVSGASCSGVEDVQDANGTVMVFIMAGYFFAIVVGVAGGNPVLSWLGTLCPVFNVFCAPVQYFSGGVPFWALGLSWLIQIVTVAALFLLCARVYEELLLHKGQRLKMKEILAMAKGGGRR